MRRAVALSIAAVVGAWACASASVLEILPQRSQVDVFPGAHTAEVLFRNPGAEQINARLSFRLYQLSSATAMPIADWNIYKPLTVLPGQTVLESVPITLPAVRAKTSFEIRWADASGISIGATVLTAYPSNLLDRLASSTEPVGLYDPQLQIRPLLARVGVAIVDVHPSTLEKFTGHVFIAAVFGHETLDLEMQEKLFGASERGARIVSIIPSSSSAGTVVFVHGATGGRMALANARDFLSIQHSPMAQLQLIDLVRMITKTNLHPFQAQL